MKKSICNMFVWLNQHNKIEINTARKKSCFSAEGKGLEVYIFCPLNCDPTDAADRFQSKFHHGFTAFLLTSAKLRTISCICGIFNHNIMHTSSYTMQVKEENTEKCHIAYTAVLLL